MERLDLKAKAEETRKHFADLSDYAAMTRRQALDAEARGNLPLARELTARADEAEALRQLQH